MYYDNTTTIANEYGVDRRAIKRLLELGVIKKGTIQKGVKLGKQIKGIDFLIAPDNLRDYIRKKSDKIAEKFNP